VSTPLRWAEVERAARSRDAASLAFEARQVLARVEKAGDLFAPVLFGGQRLPAASALERAHAR
jgi:bifunctional non-homologous end joining protein LigD